MIVCSCRSSHKIDMCVEEGAANYYSTTTISDLEKCCFNINDSTRKEF